MEVFEERLLSISECFLYRVPPLRKTSGHRAEEWGLAKPTMTSRLELVGVGDVLEIRILSCGEESKRVAMCPVRCGPGSPSVDAVVDPVVDSSRYFVLRCEDEKRRHAYVGIGFSERDVAYDFKATIFDFSKKIARQTTAAQAVKDRENIPEDETPSVDLKLKGPIKISLAGHSRRKQQDDEDEFGEFESA